MLLYLWDPLHLLKNLFPFRYGFPWSFVFVFSYHCYHKDWKYMFSLCVIDHLIWCVIWNCSDFSQFYTIARESQDSADYPSVSLIIILKSYPVWCVFCFSDPSMVFMTIFQEVRECTWTFSIIFPSSGVIFNYTIYHLLPFSCPGP